MHSSMTLDEFLEILNSLDCEYEVYENEEENFRWIYCDLFGAEFIVFPIGPGPFFEVFSFEAIRPAELDPETMCTQFNKMQDLAKAIPFDLNDTGVYNDDDLDEESNVVIAIRKQVSLEGGVSQDFLRSTIRLWGGMLLSNEGFFEGPTVEAADGDDDE